MDNKYYMSLGFPIGLCENGKEETFYNVELADDFNGLSNISYEIWKFCFFDVKKEEDIFKQLHKILKIDRIMIRLEFEKLKELKLIIEIDTSTINNIYDKLKLLTPMKNGFGVGLNKTKTECNIINQGQPFLVSPLEFCIWAECNNRKNIKQIVEKISKEYNKEFDVAKQVVINAIFKLKTLDLLRINLKEKREKTVED